MGRMLFCVLFISSLFQFATSLECYSCSTYKSMEACSQSVKKITCPSSGLQPRCYNMTVQVYSHFIRQNITGFQRGCAIEEACAKKQCTGHFGPEVGSSDYNYCHIECCQGNLCPEGNVTKKVFGPEKGARSGSGPVPRTVLLFVFLVGCHLL